jgi:hypothetical protein
MFPPAMTKARAPGRKNAGDQISMNLHGPDVFPHLQAGAVRRPLSSKPKPGESKKVPKLRDDFRYFHCDDRGNSQA